MAATLRFALVDGQRLEAQPGLVGTCPACDGELIPKCGEVRDRHWAHVSLKGCDSWHESEGSWHRAWKAQFPDSWHEYVHQAENGDRHIADVKTGRGWAIEFQHSHLKPEERRAREASLLSYWLVSAPQSYKKTVRSGAHPWEYCAPKIDLAAFAKESGDLAREIWWILGAKMIMEFDPETL